MKIRNLTKDSGRYTSNVYLLLGTWNTLEDVNTLIDVGADPAIFDMLSGINTGVGKRPIDQVILTHSHSDHAALLPEVVERFGPAVYAWSGSPKVPVKKLHDGQTLRIGDERATVIHAPGHSNDSVCVYLEKSRILFSGDAPLFIRTPEARYGEGMIGALKRIARLRIEAVMPGHGETVTGNIEAMLAETIKNVSGATGVTA